MRDKVIVASDQHLGYENSDIDAFIGFLDYLGTRNDVSSLVMLGDIIDMWRRDVSGLFLEISEVIKKLLALPSSGLKVYFVAGNHDYHLLKLQSHQYPFQFLSEWSSSVTVNSESLPDNSMESTKPAMSSSTTTTATESNTRYIFKHGWEFDLAQHPVIMEALCHNLSDEAGSIRTSAYNALQMFRSQFSKVLNEIIDFHNKKSSEGYLDNLLQPPEQRLQPYLSDVEKKAYSSIQQNEILVFGHTHRPFVSSDRKIANSGSWVKDAPVHNTFVELDLGNIRLFQFVNKTATDITKENIIQITS